MRLEREEVGKDRTSLESGGVGGRVGGGGMRRHPKKLNDDQKHSGVQSRKREDEAEEKHVESESGPIFHFSISNFSFFETFHFSCAFESRPWLWASFSQPPHQPSGWSFRSEG